MNKKKTKETQKSNGHKTARAVVPPIFKYLAIIIGTICVTYIVTHPQTSDIVLKSIASKIDRTDPEAVFFKK